MSTDGPQNDALATNVGFLIKSLRALGRSGDPDAANRLAAQAWLALRDDHPREAERLNGAMHYLVRLPQASVPDSTHSLTDQESK